MPAAPRKRPFYLVFALLGALALGGMNACGGWEIVELYQPIDPSVVVGQSIADEADRAAVIARFEGYLHALDAAKGRQWPLAVASLLLGSAVLVAATRALSGNSGARSALVQLVIAQAGANAAGYWLLRDVSEARMRFHEAVYEAQDARYHPLESSRPDEAARRRIFGIAAPIKLATTTLGSVLIVIALTRRRARALLDAPPEAVEER
jgi:hypothetical protein